MTALINAIVYIMLRSSTVGSGIEVCDKPIDHLTLEQKIEFSIGCSTVNSHRVFTNYTLEGIYERR